MDSEFLDMLANELGEISHWKEECPGVYYLSILPESERTLLCAEYYLVLDNAPISNEARGYHFAPHKGPIISYRRQH